MELAEESVDDIVNQGSGPVAMWSGWACFSLRDNSAAKVCVSPGQRADR